MTGRKYQTGAMAALLAGACALTYYFHAIHGIGIIFTHLFYLPIILACLWWKRKGLIVAVFLAAFLIFSHVLFRPDVTTVNDYFRAVMFIVIAFVVAKLSERIAQREEALRASNQQLQASEQQLRASNQQLDASNQHLRVSEQEIRNMEEDWRESFNSLEDVMMLIDRDFNVEKSNATGLKLIGKSEEDVVGRKCYEVFHGLSTPCKGCPLKESLRTQKVESLDYFAENYGRHLSIKSSPIFDEKGTIIRFVDLMRDITERKRAKKELQAAYEQLQASEQQLRASNERLQAEVTMRKRAEDSVRKAQEQLIEQQRHETERMEAELSKIRDELVRTTRLAAIGQMSASIAHDLRNPLGTVRNAVYYLNRRNPNEESEVAEYLGIINEEVNTADRIITNLLQLAQAKKPVTMEIDLGTLIESVRETYCSAASVQWQIRLHPDPFVVEADENQLRQVLINLGNNAVEAMKGKGEILVEATRREEEDEILIRDTGPGVSEQVRETLFEPLVTTKSSGTGLGLTISRQIIEAHGGQIECIEDNQVGAGFRFRLPRKKTDPELLED